MFDIRSDQQIALYKPPNANSGFTSCGLSLSGRILFCGSDDNSVHMWDTLKNQHNGKSFFVSFPLFSLKVHVDTTPVLNKF